ncbi:serine/threonine-protein kinase DCLK3 isoform X2 [Dromiciops gliroides]|uniref:serine/threonine-protein kinase DCLK3 isoform X2 n=1 Tax=Dromiciops gliroides TaxID=33562 RepID=UPI001CC78623|nr:serine/threonine-protein kinase DCLK3 isoform X2 [Dromiciops gliroides]
MPAAPPPPSLPAPGHPPGGAPRPGPGHRGGLDHSLKYLSSRITERRLQGSSVPSGRGGLCGKPLVGAQRSVCPVFSPQSGFHPIHAENSVMKPRVVTVVKPGGPPLRKITLLLNRRSVQTFEQLVADISEALGFPRWKNDRVRKLYSLKGKEVKSVSDFFREGDAFIAMGREPLTLKSIQTAMEELSLGKPRALTLTQHSWAPSPRLKSRPHSKALKAEQLLGDAEGPKSRSQASFPKVGPKPEGKAELQPGAEERLRTQKKWGPEHHAKPDRKVGQEEAPPNGEKHRDSPLDKSSGEMIRCEKCKQERALRSTPQRQRLPELSLGSSELDLGKGPRGQPERMVRMKSCRGPLWGTSPTGDEVWGKGASWRDSPRAPSLELERPPRMADKKERRDLEAHERAEPAPAPGPAAARGRREGAEAQPIPEGAPPQGDPRSGLRARQSGWLLRERQASAERPPRGPEAEREDRGQRGCLQGGRRQAPGEGALSRPDKEAKLSVEEPKPGQAAGKKLRLADGSKANVEAHYEVGKVIGDGNFAVVKECRHLASQRAYAMKIIDKSKLKGKEDMVDSEIFIIRSLSHPNIVKLHEVYETAAQIFLILEYVRGGDLFDAILEHVKFSEQDAACMITDLGRALVHMHDKRIVHRDLKPENLLVQRNADKSTTLKLADFGLAKHVVKPLFTVCGTPTYVAPEILSEKGYGLEVDIWAAGVILYVLLCGFPPFRSQERDQEELFAIIQRGRFDFLRPYWDNISEAAKDLVRQLLVVDPKKRYTAHQVLEHPWIKATGKASPVYGQAEVTTASELSSRSQGKDTLEGDT